MFLVNIFLILLFVLRIWPCDSSLFFFFMLFLSRDCKSAASIDVIFEDFNSRRKNKRWYHSLFFDMLLMVNCGCALCHCCAALETCTMRGRIHGERERERESYMDKRKDQLS
jgi:hypothetical protein